MKHKQESPRPFREPTPDMYFVADSVKDNGIGIPTEFQERAFGVFKRLHNKDVPGTGIGLALCKRIVENYGGRIWIESQADHGTTVLFTVQAERSA